MVSVFVRFNPGINCWKLFATQVLRLDRAWPPPLDGLLAWSRTFRFIVRVCGVGRCFCCFLSWHRCSRTFANYLAHARTGCLLADECDTVFDHPALKRAKTAITKAEVFAPRRKMFLQLSTLQSIMPALRGDPMRRTTLMWMLAAYAFLLRVPSECLPITVAGSAAREKPPRRQAEIWLSDKQIVLRLKRRKNKPHGSRLVRQCWCRQCPLTCPVHVLGSFLKCGRQCVHLVSGFLGLVCAGRSQWAASPLQASPLPKLSRL